MKIPYSGYSVDFRHLLAIGFVLMVLDSVIERISVILGRKAKAKIEVNTKQTTIEIKDISEETYSIIDTKYLLVRYGANEFLEQDPAPSDKRKMKVRNNEFPVDTDHQKRDHTLEATVPLRIHKNLPTEFKLFVEVEDASRLETVKKEFDSSPSCESASISDSLDDKVYFLLNEFKTTESPEGFQNNVVYPK